MNKKIGSDWGYATLIVSGAILISILSVDLVTGSSPFFNIFMIAVIALALFILWLAEKDERETRKSLSDLDAFAEDRKTMSNLANEHKADEKENPDGQA